MASKYTFLKIGIVGLLGFGAYKLWSLRKASELFQYTISKIGIGNFTLTGFKISFNLNIQNPSNQSFKVDKFVGNIMRNDKVISSFSTGQIQIQKNQTSSVAIKSLITYSNGLDLVGSTRNTSKASGKAITIKGLIYANGVQVPVKYDYTF